MIFTNPVIIETTTNHNSPFQKLGEWVQAFGTMILGKACTQFSLAFLKWYRLDYQPLFGE